MSKCILVVEDQPDNRQIIRDMLALLTIKSRKPRMASRRLRRSQSSDSICGAEKCFSIFAQRPETGYAAAGRTAGL